MLHRKSQTNIDLRILAGEVSKLESNYCALKHACYEDLTSPVLLIQNSTIGIKACIYDISPSKIIKFFNEKFDPQLRLHQKKTRVVKGASLDTPQTVTYHYAQYLILEQRKRQTLLFYAETPVVTGRKTKENLL